jgi:hypothetical protein
LLLAVVVSDLRFKLYAAGLPRTLRFDLCER